jgi:hypothetical protein
MKSGTWLNIIVDQREDARVPVVPYFISRFRWQAKEDRKLLYYKKQSTLFSFPAFLRRARGNLVAFAIQHF